jgi:hypothetical protein
MRCPETFALANAAYKASGCKRYDDFIALFGEGAIGRRSFCAWMKGERPAEPLARLVLREFIAGWRPTLQMTPESGQ